MLVKYVPVWKNQWSNIICRYKSCVRNATNSMPIKAALIDLSGTLHVEDQPTPDAVNALTRLSNDVPNNTPIPIEMCIHHSTSTGCEKLES